MANRRPSMSFRTMSTPESIAGSSPPNQNYRSLTGMNTANMLTPPASPLYSRSSTDLTSRVEDFGDSCHDESVLNYTAAIPESEQQIVDGVLICPYRVEILKDLQGNNQTFGYGAWSTVFRATCYTRTATTSGLVTPPPFMAPKPPVLVAVKKAARSGAKPILKNEAKMLTSLMQIDDHEQFVIKLHGIDLEDESIVLEAYPLSLEQHIQTCAKVARATLTTENMSIPVLGSVSIWTDLAQKLISGLEWLHNEAGIVHGDIKPANVLLSSDGGHDTRFAFQPLFADFSSSQSMDMEEITLNTLSAVTREYTAPELLSSAVLRNPNSTATPASDVFSLAVTLLTAATGDTAVYPGTSFQRQAMATQGWYVLDFARSGDEAARVPRQGMVSRVLERAVLKANMGRISSIQWKTLISTMIMETPMKR